MKLRPVCTLLVVIGLSGCGGCDDSGLETLVRILTPASFVLDVGDVYVGATATAHTAALTLTQSGNRSSQLVEPTIEDDADAAFTVVSAPSVVGLDESQDVVIGFSPTVAGNGSATLIIDSDADNRPLHIELVGTGLEPPDCDDAEDCTDDQFEPDAELCLHAARDGTCDDGSACTVGDLCAAGRCVGAALSCNDDVDCTVDACDALRGCVFIKADAACADEDPCSLDRCHDDALGNGCTHEPAPDGTTCGEAVTCVSADICLSQLCTTIPIPDGAPCNDGDICTETDRCGAGVCAGTDVLTPPVIVKESQSWGVAGTGAVSFIGDRIFVGGTSLAELVRNDVDGTLAPVSRQPSLAGLGRIHATVEDAVFLAAHRPDGVRLEVVALSIQPDAAPVEIARLDMLTTATGDLIPNGAAADVEGYVCVFNGLTRVQLAPSHDALVATTLSPPVECDSSNTWVGASFRSGRSARAVRFSTTCGSASDVCLDVVTIDGATVARQSVEFPVPAFLDHDCNEGSNRSCIGRSVLVDGDFAAAVYEFRDHGSYAWVEIDLAANAGVFLELATPERVIAVRDDPGVPGAAFITHDDERLRIHHFRAFAGSVPGGDVDVAEVSAPNDLPFGALSAGIDDQFVVPVSEHVLGMWRYGESAGSSVTGPWLPRAQGFPKTIRALPDGRLLFTGLPHSVALVDPATDDTLVPFERAYADGLGGVLATHVNGRLAQLERNSGFEFARTTAFADPALLFSGGAANLLEIDGTGLSVSQRGVLWPSDPSGLHQMRSPVMEGCVGAAVHDHVGQSVRFARVEGCSGVEDVVVRFTEGPSVASTGMATEPLPFLSSTMQGGIATFIDATIDNGSVWLVDVRGATPTARGVHGLSYATAPFGRDVSARSDGAHLAVAVTGSIGDNALWLYDLTPGPDEFSLIATERGRTLIAPDGFLNIAQKHRVLALAWPVVYVSSHPGGTRTYDGNTVVVVDGRDGGIQATLDLGSEAVDAVVVDESAVVLGRTDGLVTVSPPCGGP